MDDELHLRRPSAGEIKDVIATVGAADPSSRWPPPPQEAPPRWRRVAQGLGHSKKRDSSAISKHYDVSNTFYEYVLGPSMTYTCAVYPTPDVSLEQAQDAKHALVFDKLGLQPGQRLLDVGCGWGSMVRHAARRGVPGSGRHTVPRSRRNGARRRSSTRVCSISPRSDISITAMSPETGFDAISSIGLTEHIGVKNYPAYFRSLQDQLRPGGRLLNHCITRPIELHAR